ncbi:transmembrane 220 family protein [Fibrella sp. WM1]|uniref:transmembrane 220 family protein n=1 Tax=Fibrella musci TaxID=3242485 RepID=UPI003523050B
MKYLSLGFALLFIMFAAVQYNDPDPQVWVPIYGFAAVACLLACIGFGGRHVPTWFYWLMAVVYLGGAISQWPPSFEGFLLNEVGMKTMNIELARESGGLAICALAMALLAWLGRK